MSQDVGDNKNKVYKVVLTGGPCGGKTTGQARLATFFENLGWKVYRAPETALVLMSGGIKFSELTGEQAFRFQANLIKTMMQIENSYFDLAQSCQQNCLVICDRGIMDASAYLPPVDWDKMRTDNGWNEVDIRDNRYNQVIHMVSAARGAEDFYTCQGHKTRSEDLGFAKSLDVATSHTWVGHPYYDVIDNSTDFEEKVIRMIHAVCNRLGIDAGDRLHANSKKRKFLVANVPETEKFPQKFQDFDVLHDYLATPSRKMQARLRKRGQNESKWYRETSVGFTDTYRHITPSMGVWTYTHTIRRPEINKQSVELRMAINFKDYNLLLNQKDQNHHSIHKQRRCFLWNNQYFQMDIYTDPCPTKCTGLILLETYTTKTEDLDLPDFLHIEREVTDDPYYSMYNLSLKETFSTTKFKSLSRLTNSHDDE